MTTHGKITTRVNIQNANNPISFDCNRCNRFDILNSLKIVSYNVDGLFSKLSDLDFLSFIDQFDCVCLLETYMIDNTIPKNIFKEFLPAFFTQQFAQQVKVEHRVELLYLLNTSMKTSQE